MISTPLAINTVSSSLEAEVLLTFSVVVVVVVLLLLLVLLEDCIDDELLGDCSSLEFVIQ